MKIVISLSTADARSELNEVISKIASVTKKSFAKIIAFLKKALYTTNMIVKLAGREKVKKLVLDKKPKSYNDFGYTVLRNIVLTSYSNPEIIDLVTKLINDVVSFESSGDGFTMNDLLADNDSINSRSATILGCLIRISLSIPDVLSMLLHFTGLASEEEQYLEAE